MLFKSCKASLITRVKVVMALIDLIFLICRKGMSFSFHTVIIECFKFKLHSPPGQHHVPLQEEHHLAGDEPVDSVL